MVSEEEVEMAARAIAEAWGETWECCCAERRGLDCDCGDAMTDEREAYDERLSREDCRMAARAALEAAARVRAEDNAEGGEVRLHCEKCSACFNTLWERQQHEREDHPAPQPSGTVEALPLREAMRVMAGLAAATSLLERSPKTAAPSDRMFDQMLTDYRNALDAARSALTAGGGDE